MNGKKKADQDELDGLVHERQAGENYPISAPDEEGRSGTDEIGDGRESEQPGLEERRKGAWKNMYEGALYSSMLSIVKAVVLEDAEPEFAAAIDAVITSPSLGLEPDFTMIGSRPRDESQRVVYLLEQITELLQREHEAGRYNPERGIEPIVEELGTVLNPEVFASMQATLEESSIAWAEDLIESVQAEPSASPSSLSETTTTEGDWSSINMEAFQRLAGMDTLGDRILAAGVLIEESRTTSSERNKQVFTLAVQQAFDSPTPSQESAFRVATAVLGLAQQARVPYEFDVLDFVGGVRGHAERQMEKNEVGGVSDKTLREFLSHLAACATILDIRSNIRVGGALEHNQFASIVQEEYLRLLAMETERTGDAVFAPEGGIDVESFRVIVNNFAGSIKAILAAGGSAKSAEGMNSVLVQLQLLSVFVSNFNGGIVNVFEKGAWDERVALDAQASKVHSDLLTQMAAGLDSMESAYAYVLGGLYSVSAGQLSHASASLYNSAVVVLRLTKKVGEGEGAKAETNLESRAYQDLRIQQNAIAFIASFLSDKDPKACWVEGHGGSCAVNLLGAGSTDFQGRDEEFRGSLSELASTCFPLLNASGALARAKIMSSFRDMGIQPEPRAMPTTFELLSAAFRVLSQVSPSEAIANYASSDMEEFATKMLTDARERSAILSDFMASLTVAIDVAQDEFGDSSSTVLWGRLGNRFEGMGGGGGSLATQFLATYRSIYEGVGSDSRLLVHHGVMSANQYESFQHRIDDKGSYSAASMLLQELS